MSPLLAAIHTAEVTVIAPLIVVGAAAVYLLLPRPRPYSTTAAILLAALAILGARGLLLSTAAVTPETILFYAFAVIAVISGGLLVTQHNPARAALAFAVVILSTCGLFLLLAAPFLAAATIIIYAGAIIVTFLFVLMLAQQLGRSDADDRSREPLFSTFTGFILLGALVYVLQVTYAKNDNVAQAESEVLARTRAARQTADALQPRDFNHVAETLKEPLDNVLSAAPRPLSPREEKLASLRALIENTMTRANTSDDVKLLLDQIETRVLATQQQAGSVQPAVKDHVLSNLSGPAANEPRENLRYDDQGRPRLPADNAEYLGRSLFTDYLLPVELGGFLLLVAVIGAIAIAHRRPPVLPSERLP